MICTKRSPYRRAPAYRKSPPTASFSDIFGVSLSPLRGSRAGNAVRKPCCTRLPNPPHMSLDSDCYWRASALQTSREGFGAVCGALPIEERLSVLGNARPSKRLAHIELNRPGTLFGAFGRMLGQKARKAYVIKRQLHRLIRPGRKQHGV